MWKGFMVYLFGSRYEKAVKSGLICLFVFWGLRQAEISLKIAPGILYLMTGAVTACSMWQDLSAENEVMAGKNLFMLPFSGRKLIVSYVGALSLYTFLTHTALVLSLALAVSFWGAAELTGSLLSALYGSLLTAWIYGERKYRKRTLLWIAATIVFGLFFSSTWLFSAGMALSCFVAVCFLIRIDAYVFYEGSRIARKETKLKNFGQFSIWTYFLRYLSHHKNYLVNTLILWGVAAGLPLCLGQTDRSFALPIGLSLLTLNTPICILLSADPHLEQAVRMLPGQKRSFILPYGLFLFTFNLIGAFIFLLSFEMQGGGGSGRDLVMAVLIAGLGALGSAEMEWHFPIRSWKTKSDLWHHPRKYVVPGSLLLISGLFASWF